MVFRSRFVFGTFLFLNSVLEKREVFFGFRFLVVFRGVYVAVFRRGIWAGFRSARVCIFVLVFLRLE